MRVVYVRPSEPAWNVITAMARLTARLLEADYVEVPIDRARRPIRRVASLFPRLRRGVAVFLIAPHPIDLNGLLEAQFVTRGSAMVAAWVVDSWWDERIPRIARDGRHLDLLYISETENLEVWKRATGAQVRWLAQGSNVLDWGTCNPTRPVTIQRIGRQPGGWDDDQRVSDAAARRGLVHAGRPPFVVDPESAMQDLMARFGQARFTLAFTNRVGNDAYTHPHLEYLTGRWTDSLACGATVAGIPPRSESASTLLWPGALLNLQTVDVEKGLDVLSQADAAWTPESAVLNYRMALRRLDWRHRINSVAGDLGLMTSTLQSELQRLANATRSTGDDSTGAQGGT